MREGAERSEKLQSVMVVESVFHHWDPVIDTPASQHRAVPREEAPSLPLRNQYDLREQCRDWLLNAVEQSYWDDVGTEFDFQLTFLGRVPSVRPAPLTDLIATYRPDFTNCGSNEMVSLYAVWGLHWLLAFTRIKQELRSIMADGLRMAKERWKQLTAIEKLVRTRNIRAGRDFPMETIVPLDVQIESLHRTGVGA